MWQCQLSLRSVQVNEWDNSCFKKRSRAGLGHALGWRAPHMLTALCHS